MQLHKGLALDALLENPAIRSGLKGIRRGIEREALRITPEGRLAVTMHPEEKLGATLTHPAITTDYAEALLEFITPVSRSVEETLAQLRDLHRVTYTAIGDERLWPLSMPCYVNELSDIRIAQYGDSHSGIMKRTYRQGLTHRYGAMMQTIAGVHYNFSVSDELWAALAAEDGDRDNRDFRSARYLGLIRNFKRLAWVVPYMFGASPLLCKSFLRHTEIDIGLEEMGGGLAGFPYATSLRMSDLGYTNREQAELGITYNSLQEYVDNLRCAVFTPVKRFEEIGIRDGNEWKQLSANILQIENEFYSPIRPKQIALEGETPAQALENRGIEYIEVRVLDVNPFSNVGISADQMRFIDLLLLYCLLDNSSPLSWEEQVDTERLVSEVIKHGRTPGLQLTDSNGIATVEERLTALFKELNDIAVVLDKTKPAALYQQSLAALAPAITDPEQTLSGKVMEMYLRAVAEGDKPGMRLAEMYRTELMGGELEYYTHEQFAEWTKQSIADKAALEASSEGTFGEFLADYFERAQAQKKRPKRGAKDSL